MKTLSHFLAFISKATNLTLQNIGVINNISLVMPNFALHAEPQNVRESMFCDSDSKMSTSCLPGTKFCHCIHRLKVKRNSIVELLLIDIQDGLTHPFHLHGHKFFVMEMGAFLTPTTSQAIRVNGVKRRNRNKQPVHRDTVLVPNKGFVRLKFRADNPGFWLAHCHFEWHLAIGMGFILQVGELDEMPKPPEHFATCRNYLPTKINKVSIEN